MDATLMFSASTTPQATAAPTPVAAAGAPSGGVLPGGSTDTAGVSTQKGQIFAGLMRGLLPTHERQDVAAPSDLKSETLGSDLEVITASSPQPDTSSLATFARAQGLDESAVKALFGEMQTVTSSPTASTESAESAAALNTVLTATIAAAQSTANVADQAASATETPPPSATALDLPWLAHALSAEITLSHAPAPETESPHPGAASDDSNLTSASWLATQATPLVQATQVASMLQTGKAAPLLSATQAGVVAPPTVIASPLNLTPTTRASALSLSRAGGPTAGIPGLPATHLPIEATPAPVSLSVTSSSAWNPMRAALQPLLATKTLPTASSESPAPAVATDAILSTQVSTSPEEAMRIRLIPAWANVTQQLTQMSGTAMTAAWGALTAATLGGPIRSVALDLSSTAQQLANDTEEVSLGTSDSGWNTANMEPSRTTGPGTTLPSTAPSLPGMAQTLRNEHYQQLADRLGQAMAERLQSQIARGEWKLQMRLNPANLGRIDVELDMHAGGLDAMFRSDNAVTRELMAQGMPKLKDTLAQSGMAVASVWVNSDAGRQSDGNPTPQKDWTPPADTPLTAKAETTPVAVTKEKRNQDGFDALA